MKTLLRPAVSVFILLSLITGLIYPLVVTGLGHNLFPSQANGSLISKNGTLIGSELIGQNFTGPSYFWGRPSATTPNPYNATGSTGSNQGPLNPALVEAVKARINALHVADPHNTAPIPVDLVTASASGLDPHISVAAALYQAERVARQRHLPSTQVHQLIEQYTQGRQWHLLGEPRVNVLKLNLALDNLKKH